MKIAALISRILLGILFLGFRTERFSSLYPHTFDVRSGWIVHGALFLSHYLVFVVAVQVVGGVLLANRFVPLALILLGPILVNILLFHSLMAPEGLPMAIFATALWVILFSRVRRAFIGVFVQSVSVY